MKIFKFPVVVTVLVNKMRVFLSKHNPLLVVQIYQPFIHPYFLAKATS